jgi:hypothetical protein
MTRQSISTTELYAILQREFQARKASDCDGCLVPLPIFKVPVDKASANWYMGTPAECPFHCRDILAEVVARLSTQYDLERRKRKWRERRRPVGSTDGR